MPCVRDERKPNKIEKETLEKNEGRNSPSTHSHIQSPKAHQAESRDRWGNEEFGVSLFLSVGVSPNKPSAVPDIIILVMALTLTCSYVSVSKKEVVMMTFVVIVVEFRGVGPFAHFFSYLTLTESLSIFGLSH